MENMAADQYIVLTLEQLNHYGQIVGKTAIEEFVKYQKEQSKNLVDNFWRNIEMLLKNYRKLKASVNNTTYSIKQLEGEMKKSQFLSLMLDEDYDYDTLLKRIQSSMSETYLLVKHIDYIIGLYKKLAENSKDDEYAIRRFNILYDRYISDYQYSIEELADKYYISDRMVYEDIRNAEKTLGTLIFPNVHFIRIDKRARICDGVITF